MTFQRFSMVAGKKLRNGRKRRKTHRQKGIEHRPSACRADVQTTELRSQPAVHEF